MADTVVKESIHDLETLSKTPKEDINKNAEEGEKGLDFDKEKSSSDVEGKVATEKEPVKDDISTPNGDINTETSPAQDREPEKEIVIEKEIFPTTSQDKEDKGDEKMDTSTSDTTSQNLPNGDATASSADSNHEDSPGCEDAGNNPTSKVTQTKGPRAKMTLSPNKAPPSKTIAHYFQTMAKGSARKSLSSSFSDRSTDSNAKSKYSAESDSAKDTETMKKALNIALSDGKAKSPGLAEVLLAKKQPKARKSFQPRASSSRESTPLSIKSNSSGSIANMTIKVPELENALGIKRQSLDKLDAKTFDQIVLAKASRAGQSPPVVTIGTSSPNSRSLLKPLHQILAESAEKQKKPVKEDQESANISAVITSQKILKKRKRRKPKLGTYKLPGAKKDYKKKGSTAIGSKDKIRTWTQKCKNSSKVRAIVAESNKSNGLGSSSEAKAKSSDDTSSIVEVKQDPAEQIMEGTCLTATDTSSIFETDDSFVTEKSSKKKKKAGRRSKWQRGFIPSKKHQKKAKAANAFPPKLEKLNIVYKKRSRPGEENPVLRNALNSAVKEPPANLSEDKSSVVRRSGRKRKANELDDGCSVASSGVESDSGASLKKRKLDGTPFLSTGNGLNSESGSCPVKKKRSESLSPPILSQERMKSESRAGSSSPLLSQQLTARAGSKLPTQPKADNQLKQVLIRSSSKSKSPEEKSYNHSMGSVPGLFRKKLSEGELAAVPTNVQSHRQVEGATVHKYVNTPNGLSYPVTPPVTPDNRGHEEREEGVANNKIEGGDRDRDFIPLCCCKVTGNSYTNSKQVMYCQALDSIHGKVVGCCNKVSNKQLIRPAIKVPFMAVCEAHRQRMKQHQCCPGCGHFCTEGKFLQCRKDCQSKVVHYYHRQCQVFKDNKYYCPHCGEESMQYEVTLRLSEQQSKASFLARDEPKPKQQSVAPLSNRARMSMDRSEARRSAESTSIEANLVSTSVAKGKTISSLGLEGPEKDDLATAIAILEGDNKTKKLRVGPKTLYGASKMGDIEKVLYMLMEGTDPNTKFDDYGNQTALHAAAEGGSLLVAHILMQADASPHVIDDDLRTPLMNAAEQGHVDVMELLIKCGAHVEMKAEDGMTCLHLAAKCGKTDAVKYLVNTKMVDVNVTDDGGWTPIIWAAEHRHLLTVKYLVEVGADPNIKDNEENTGLHWAAFAGSVDIAELFLNAGCDIEGANMHGDRPLHIAARQDHYECVVLLLARSADSEARNNDNETALTCCVDKESQCWMALRVNRALKGIAAQRIGKSERLLHRDISMGRETNAIPVVNSVDDANYPQDFLYVSDYVETSPINVNRVITSLQSCKCRDNCSSLFCVCGRNSIRCWYEPDGRLVKDFNFSDPPLVFECNKACRCWNTCQNRVVQLGVTCRLQVFRTAGRGWGARTLLDIPQGTFVCEYIGELITDAEADSREDDSYLFDLDNKDADTFCIDARKYGNISRFVNHLCEPNLTPVKVFVDHQDLRFPRICFFATRDIKAHEELGFDYGEKFWIIKWKQFTCTCGSPKCRYSKETIHQTLEEYNKRQEEELAVSQG